MTLTIIGAGYVGLTSAVVYAELGHTVYLARRSIEKLEALKRGEVDFYEPGLSEAVRDTINRGTLRPTTDLAGAVSDSSVVMICVGTPPREDGSADLSQVFAVAETIAPLLADHTVVVNKSTVPVGTGEKVEAIIQKRLSKQSTMSVASCPEFLREGTALADLRNPDRIVIGTESIRARSALLELHRPLPGKRVVTDRRSAELIKYSSNAFLATKISFINEIANLCDEVGANVDDVAYGMGLDPRIGSAFLHSGIGYGGSCFPKDTQALHSIALEHDYEFKLLKAVIEVNQAQRRQFIRKIKKTLGEVRDKTIGVLGLSFKPFTDDIRQSASIDIVRWLHDQGARVVAYDPQAEHKAMQEIPRLQVCPVAEEVFTGAHAVLVLTEWPQFRCLPWAACKQGMISPIVFDGRNMLDAQHMREMGFQYYSVGRP
ncbi:UDP-glucose/GDP-mannose dehydrogenase family protein [Candidatus Uhrbacteria bacterium]|nr:UDP-glucose/GDP-mannose dehydrogenase family protein [Candidatus Uhrbacteria bacterium]